MLTETPSRGPGEVHYLSEHRIRKRQGQANDQAQRDGDASSMDLGATLPDFADVMHGVTRMLRDVEALRFAVRSLIPEPDRVQVARLIQRRYRMSALRARSILGLVPKPKLLP